MRMLVLVGILTVILPVVLFAQTSSTTTSNTSSYFTGGCMTVSPGNTEIQTLRNQLTCVFNLVIDLSDKVKSLENRVNVLEARTILTPVPTVGDGTIGCRYMENGKGMICLDGPKPVDGTDGVKIIQDFLKGRRVIYLSNSNWILWSNNQRSCKTIPNKTGTYSNGID